jgi:hypothetical protein
MRRDHGPTERARALEGCTGTALLLAGPIDPDREWLKLVPVGLTMPSTGPPRSGSLGRAPSWRCQTILTLTTGSPPLPK